MTNESTTVRLTLTSEGRKITEATYGRDYQLQAEMDAPSGVEFIGNLQYIIHCNIHFVLQTNMESKLETVLRSVTRTVLSGYSTIMGKNKK